MCQCVAWERVYLPHRLQLQSVKRLYSDFTDACIDVLQQLEEIGSGPFPIEFVPTAPVSNSCLLCSAISIPQD
eukprot:701580-Prorocentrum_lima.AAC.1